MADDAPSGRQPLDEATSDSSSQSGPAVFHFEEAYDAVKDKPVRVQQVLIQGLERTKDEIIMRELEPVQHVRTLDELKDVLLEAHDALDSLDIFEGVEIVIGDSNTVGHARRHALAGTASADTQCPSASLQRCMWTSR